MQLKLWIKTAVIFLLIATFLGAFLRYLFINPIPGVNFDYFRHTHSHVAFLGWIFNALYAGILYSFIPKDYENAKKYNWLFILLVMSVVGMMFSFPFQGYAAVSITFSTLHVFLSVVFAVYFVKDSQAIYGSSKPLSLHFVYWSLAFLILSALGPFALGYLMAKDVPGPYSELAIYFYLHFQYDGWFTFAIFALLYHFLEKNGIVFNKKYGRYFLLIFAICCLPAYASSTLWTRPPSYVYTVALAASFFQVVGIFFFWKSIRNSIQEIVKAVDKWALGAIVFALLCFVLKILLQLIGVEPELASMAYLVRNFLIFYLHLIFLGFVTIFIFGWLRQHGFWKLSPSILTIFTVTFILSQLMIAAQPLSIKFLSLSIPFYTHLLFFVSLGMPLTLLVGFLKSMRNSGIPD